MRTPSLLERFAAPPHPDRTAIKDAAGAHSFGRLAAKARAVSERLCRHGVGLDGARVGILAEPGAEFIEALFGVFEAGGCAVVLSPQHPEAETRYFLGDAQVRTVLCSRALLSRLPSGGSQTVVVLDEVAKATGHLLSLARPEAAALQIYTSGTTGKPKGAVITHANLAAQAEALKAAWQMREEDVLLHCLPLHHVHGLSIALLNVLGAGGCARMLPGFDAARVWEALEECSVFMAVPTVYAKLLGAFEAADAKVQARWSRHASALRLATSGSAALPVVVGERWKALSGAFPLERYGMTEVGAAISNPLSPSARVPGCVGFPLPGVKVRIVDEHGNDAPSGELWVGGPTVFPGYFGRDEETAKSFATVGGERYFRTGDTVEQGPGGVRILGRTSVDILKSGGYKLSALELEEVLRDHPAIGEVAVLGLEDVEWGERVIACVVPRPGSSVEPEQVRSWMKALVAPYKVPREVVVFSDLPRNVMGKVIKPELRRLLEARTPRR